LLVSTILFAQQTGTARRNTNVRPIASTAKKPIGKITSGESVTVLSTTKNHGFLHVGLANRKKGWAWAANLTLGPAHTASATAAACAHGTPTLDLADHDKIQPGKFAMHTASCKPWGDEDPNDDGGLRNRAKRFMAKGDVVPLTVNQFKQLQAKTDTDAVNHKHTRDTLSLTNKTVGTVTVSEGDHVSVAGFLNSAADGSEEEMVNCKTANATKDGHDLHINIGPEPNGNEFAGIVVEMIPQLRSATSRCQLAGRRRPH
jgi:uncharacterized protein YgiM (DUF1202 family)